MTKLSEVEMSDQTFKSKDFSTCNWNKKSFLDCQFESCNFTESRWESTNFQNCVFLNCNISLIKIEACRLQEVEFTDCKLLGIDFFKCNTTFFHVVFQRNIMQYCNFSGLNMRKNIFKDCKLKECHFSNTLLVEANFSGTELPGSIFHNCDLSKADFTTAYEYDIDPQTNRLKKAKFSLPEAVALLRGLDIILT